MRELAQAVIEDTRFRILEGFPAQVRSALLLRVSHHWAVRTGQIVYAAKAGRVGAVDELWMKTMKGC